MKAVLISIQPKYCELIANGKKTVEVRKTRPKLKTPFKCYIYETAGKTKYWGQPMPIPYKEGRGKVVGEFICDRIYDITPVDSLPFGGALNYGFGFDFEKTCLSAEEFNKYLDGEDGYGWHISDLKIYDKPKELGEFYTLCNNKNCNGCKLASWDYLPCSMDKEIICTVSGKMPLTSPPQSWCYVEI